MGRDELKANVESGGFVEFGKKQLPKINAQRRDKSQPDFYGVPILREAEVGFATAEELGNKPASCYTCEKQQSDYTCHLMGPSVLVKKVRGTKDSGEQIEYWPCCSQHGYGPRATGKPHYDEQLSTPDSIGLVWINAPKVGQEYGGANCGGLSGGDDCDRYRTYGAKEKWNVESGYCTVLAHDVKGGDVCAAWNDDDIIEYPEAMAMMNGDSMETVDKRRLVRSIVGREK